MKADIGAQPQRTRRHQHQPRQEGGEDQPVEPDGGHAGRHKHDEGPRGTADLEAASAQGRDEETADDRRGQPALRTNARSDGDCHRQGQRHDRDRQPRHGVGPQVVRAIALAEPRHALGQELLMERDRAAGLGHGRPVTGRYLPAERPPAPPVKHSSGAHNARTTRSRPRRRCRGRAQARALLASARFGALAYTDPETGTPAISRVAVGLDPGGLPVTLISQLSAHHAGLSAQPLAALMVGEPGPKGDPLTHPRLMIRVEAQFLAATTPPMSRFAPNGWPTIRNRRSTSTSPISASSASCRLPGFSTAASARRCAWHRPI